MSGLLRLRRRSLLAAIAAAGTGRQATAAEAPTLAGLWGLASADRRLPDGTTAPDYGAAPSGRLMIDRAGRYLLQIYAAERPDFLAGDKARGTPEEMRAAVLGSSTHFGSISIDWVAGTLTFSIEEASFPNWRGQTQTRAFSLEDETLIYSVPTRPDGTIPISVWRRLSIL